MRPPRRAPPAAGLTLIEVMIALAVASLLLLVLASYVRAARQAQQANELGHDARLTLNLAVELLREELRLAGTGPWPLPAAPELGAPPGTLLTPALQLLPAPAGNALRVRYLDDRLAGPVVARDHTFEAAVDSQGQPQLYRRSGGGSRQPLVAGLEGMAVVGGIDAAGAQVGAGEVVGRRLRALWLELAAQGERRRVLVELPAVPLAVGP